MSVSYKCKAKFSKGYIITANELQELDSDIYEELTESKYFHYLSPFNDESDIFFGLIAANIDCEKTGYFMISADDIDFNLQEILKVKEEFKKYFPNRSSLPRRFILGCCD